MRYVSLFGMTVIGFVGVMAGWVKFQEAYGIFYPTTYSENRLKGLPRSVEYVEFPSTDGTKITGLLKRGSDTSPVVVFAHGNAGDVINRVQWFRTALPDTWSGLILDYRGYGLSEGDPSVEGLKKDVRAASDYALDETGSDTLVLHGRSLGVPFVAHAARSVRPSAMILESGFPNSSEVASHIMPIPGIGYIISVSLNTVRYLEDAREEHGPIPKLILHGTRDRVLPVQLGRSLYEQAPEPKQWWEVKEAGHNNLTLRAGDEYGKKILSFLNGSIDLN